MPRAKLYRSSRFAYHVTARSNNKEWFYIPLSDCWRILTLSLSEAASRYGAEIHALVLMSNHFHLILSTPHENLDEVMRYFLSVGTQRIQRLSGRINHVFGARYRWSVLDSSTALAYVFKYVYRNPVRAGLCTRVEHYPYSSLTPGGMLLPIVEGFSEYWAKIPKLHQDRLNWLNEPTPKEQEELIGRALRRFHFKFSTSSGFQKPLRELRASYGVESP